MPPLRVRVSSYEARACAAKVFTCPGSHRPDSRWTLRLLVKETDSPPLALAVALLFVCHARAPGVVAFELRRLERQRAAAWERPDAQLRVFVEPNTDLDGDFKALCLDTDQLLRIQGYNALEIILIG